MDKQLSNQQAQGDVLLTPASVDAEQLRVMKNVKLRESNVVVFGEVTGHHHKLFGEGIETYEDTQNPLLLWVVAPSGGELRHVDEQDVLTAEHDTIVFPAGVFQVDLQRQVDPLTGAQDVRAFD